MRTRTFQATTVDEVARVLESAVADGFSPTLAVLFASPSQHLVGLIDAFRNLGIALFGATTAGELLADGDAEAVRYQQSVVGLLLDLPPSSFRVMYFPASGPDANDLGRHAGYWAQTTFEHPALLALVAGLGLDGARLAAGLRSAAPNLPVYGALAGDDYQLHGTAVFDEQGIYPEGLLGLVFDQSRITVAGTLASGWRGVGQERTITRAVGNIVYEIDAQPALEVYRRFLSVENLADLSAAAEFPLELSRADGTRVMRVAVGSNPNDGSLIFTGSIPKGSQVRFTCPPGLEIIDAAKQQADRFHAAAPTADALVLFSCAARLSALGPLLDEEIRHMHDLWQAPLVGLFSYGELGGQAGQGDFHNHTCVLVTLRDIAEDSPEHSALRRSGSASSDLNSRLQAAEIALAEMRISQRRLLQQKMAVQSLLTETSEELRLTNQRLADCNQQLRDLFDDKNEFLGVVVHDLKNPLHGIALTLELMQEGIERPDFDRNEYRQDLANMSLEIKRMTSIITQLLDHNALEAGIARIAKLPVEVAGLLRQVQVDYVMRAEAKFIDLTLDAPATLMALGDREPIREILENLVSNAIKYSPLGRRIDIRGYLAGGRVRLEVQDQGPGLTDKDKGRVFGKYARLSARPTAGEESTGLGLSIVKRFAEAMDGSAGVISVFGHGATFFVELPATDEVVDANLQS